MLELLVVIVILGLVAVLMVQGRARSRARQTVQGAYCINNARQLANALHLYAADFNDLLPPNAEGYDVPISWVPGNMTKASDATNTLYLTDPQWSKLAPYSGFSATVYKCPGDESGVAINNKWYPRVRTFSMNHAVGTKPLPPLGAVDGTWLDGTQHHVANKPWRTYGRFADMVKPTPANLWVFIDENEDSINDGSFAVQMNAPAQWIDWPGTYHNYSASIAFGDGHSELHKWTDRRTKLIGGQSGAQDDARRRQPDNPDIAWLQMRTSSKR